MYSITTGSLEAQVWMIRTFKSCCLYISAGVLFTCHPVTRNPGEMIINANYGLGEVGTFKS